MPSIKMLNETHLMHLYIHVWTNKDMKMKIWSEDSQQKEKDYKRLFSLSKKFFKVEEIENKWSRVQNAINSIVQITN